MLNGKKKEAILEIVKLLIKKGEILLIGNNSKEKVKNGMFGVLIEPFKNLFYIHFDGNYQTNDINKVIIVF